MKRINYYDSGIIALSQAVVVQAAQDYKQALETNNNRRIIECERFFTSERFKLFTNVDGKYIMDRIKKEVLEESKKEESA